MTVESLRFFLVGDSDEKTIRRELEQVREGSRYNPFRDLLKQMKGCYRIEGAQAKDGRYRRILDNHILPALRHIQVQKLTPQQIQAFYARKLKEGLSPRTLRGIHAVLHSALDNAVRWNLVARNACDSVSLPRIERHEMRCSP